MEPGGKETVCVATVPSTVASPGPNKYLRKEWSKEGKKGGREGARAERKMVANPSPIQLSPGSTHLSGFRSGCEGIYVDREKACPIAEKKKKNFAASQAGPDFSWGQLWAVACLYWPRNDSG